MWSMRLLLASAYRDTKKKRPRGISKPQPPSVANTNSTSPRRPRAATRHLEAAAVVIQKHCRGWRARRQCRELRLARASMIRHALLPTWAILAANQAQFSESLFRR